MRLGAPSARSIWHPRSWKAITTEGPTTMNMKVGKSASHLESINNNSSINRFNTIRVFQLLLAKITVMAAVHRPCFQMYTIWHTQRATLQRRLCSKIRTSLWNYLGRWIWSTQNKWSRRAPKRRSGLGSNHSQCRTLFHKGQLQISQLL